VKLTLDAQGQLLPSSFKEEALGSVARRRSGALRTRRASLWPPTMIMAANFLTDYLADLWIRTYLVQDQVPEDLVLLLVQRLELLNIK
jgi:hypothetical protein